jgi:hypothetical protein
MEQMEEVLVSLFTHIVKNPGDDIPHFYPQVRVRASYDFKILHKKPRVAKDEEVVVEDNDADEPIQK